MSGTDTTAIFTDGWFGVPASARPVDLSTFVYTSGWFGVRLVRLVPLDPVTAVQQEQKIPGQLKKYYAVGTGSSLSPGTRGSADGEQVVL